MVPAFAVEWCRDISVERFVLAARAGAANSNASGSSGPQGAEEGPSDVLKVSENGWPVQRVAKGRCPVTEPDDGVEVVSDAPYALWTRGLSRTDGTEIFAEAVRAAHILAQRQGRKI